MRVSYCGYSVLKECLTEHSRTVQIGCLHRNCIEFELFFTYYTYLLLCAGLVVSKKGGGKKGKGKKGKRRKYYAYIRNCIKTYDSTPFFPQNFGKGKAIWGCIGSHTLNRRRSLARHSRNLLGFPNVEKALFQFKIKTLKIQRSELLNNKISNSNRGFDTRVQICSGWRGK